MVGHIWGKKFGKTGCGINWPTISWLEMSREVYISIYILAVAVAVVLIPDSLTSNSAWQGHVWNTYTKQYLSLFQDRAQCISLEEGSSFRKAAQRNATLLNQANIGLFWTPAFSLDNKYEVFLNFSWAANFRCAAMSYLLDHSLGQSVNAI